MLIHLRKRRNLVCEIEKIVKNMTKMKDKGPFVKQYTQKSTNRIITYDTPLNSELNREFRNTKYE